MHCHTITYDSMSKQLLKQVAAVCLHCQVLKDLLDSAHLTVLVIHTKQLTLQQALHHTCIASSNSNVQGCPTLIQTLAVNEQYE